MLVEKDFSKINKMQLNQEQEDILKLDGNALVTANPGTGKTFLLAHKYADIIKKGTKPEQILCLTFTRKARKEMEDRIIRILKEREIEIDRSKLKVFNFHSYAQDNLDEGEVISSNLLRSSVLNYLKENKILNYGDGYLLETIVPKMENLMRYLKSFGIMPGDIKIEEAKKYLEEDEKHSKQEIDKFADDFLAMFQDYENIKNENGMDYADMLIRFLELRKIPQFEYVLVDELQDVNILEAKIALRSCRNFVAVGDKKQAIFGFQGGSILNFEKFENSNKAVLSKNYRSTDEILDYAKEYFISNTKEESHKKDLEELKSGTKSSGPKPLIYEADNACAAACELAKGMGGETAIIVRTNRQIADLSGELKARKMNFSSTFFSASGDAKNQIVSFLRGVVSSEVQDIKNAMFTPFFPCSLQKAFSIAEDKYLTTEKLTENLPEFGALRKSVEDINPLFREKIFPVCIAYGREYLSAAETIRDAYNEALRVLPKKNLDSIMAYLSASDLPSRESDLDDKKIVVTTVHKAKGREFENVIYLPYRTRDRSNFQDRIVEAILKTEGIPAEEELEEETIRVDFVAFTRAEKNLAIIPNRAEDYLNDFSEIKELDADARAEPELDENNKRAYCLFVNGKEDEAKKLRDNREKWFKEFVREHFASLEHVSFSRLPKNAYDYFVGKILNIGEFSGETEGLKVHEAIDKFCKGEAAEVSEELKPYFDNGKALIKEIKEKYPILESSERKIDVPLRSLGFVSDLMLSGRIDAIFRNNSGEYLIVDWKTSSSESGGSYYRQQLGLYRKALSVTDGIPEERIKVAVGYSALRPSINTGSINRKLDMKQPATRSFGTVSKRIERLLSWIRDPEIFFKEFMDRPKNELIWKSVAEELLKEK